MNDNELMMYSDKIFRLLFSKESESKTNDELKQLIKSVLLDVEKEGRIIGRNQILNNFSEKIKVLKSNNPKF